MKTIRFVAPLLMITGLAWAVAAAAPAEVTVTMSEVHLCCANCVKGVTTAVTPVAGAKAVADQAKRTVVVTAADKETVQKAVDALVAAGYFGKSSDATIKISAATGVPEGKVTSLEISGLHLCCAQCVTAVNGVLGKVPGITANTVKANATSFKIAGNFEAKAVMDGLQAEGLTGKIVPAAPPAAVKP